MRRSHYQYLFCVCLALVLLTGCAGRAEEPTVPPTTVETVEVTTEPTVDPKELVEEMAVVLVDGTMYTLDQYPNLKAVDLSGSTCYGSILSYIESHPQVAVTYTVDLGGKAVSNSETSVTLNPEDLTFEALLENLQYLPQLTTIAMPGITLTAEEVMALGETYPEVTLEYTVELFGETYPSDTTELDLSSLAPDLVEQAGEKLGLLTNLQTVQLSDSLSKTDVASLQDANPNATFLYSFTLFGKRLSTTDEEVEFKGLSLDSDDEQTLREALDILDNCSRFVLDKCGLDNELLAQLREDYRGKTKIVWRVFFGTGSRYNTLTDAETVRAVYNVTDETCGNLQYCEDVKYMDIGHNEYLTDLSFVGHMPAIEVLIASGCAVKELVGFENCKKLTWLELASCYKLENIEALSGCESLRFLNLCYSRVSSYAALDPLPLERFICLSPKASTEEQNTFVSIHEGCRTVFYGYSNPWTAWRYDDNGKTYNEYYKNVVRAAFNYDYLEQFLPKE